MTGIKIWHIVIVNMKTNKNEGIIGRLKYLVILPNKVINNTWEHKIIIEYLPQNDIKGECLKYLAINNTNKVPDTPHMWAVKNAFGDIKFVE